LRGFEFLDLDVISKSCIICLRDISRMKWLLQF
jgi:hypothetical protein